MKKLTSKLLFDILLTAAWTLLMLHSFTGSFIHELLGLGILALFVFHVAYNVKLMRREVPRMFSKGSGSITFRYIVVLLLTVSIVVTGVTGVLISKELLTDIQASDICFWTVLHHWASYITLVLIGIHIGLHLKMIGAVIAKPFRAHPEIIAWMRRGWNLAAAALIVCGSIASIQYELPSFAKPSTSSPVEGKDVPESDTSIEEQEDQSDLMTISYTRESYVSAVGDSVSYAASAGDDEALEEYLGSLNCTLCYKCCPLNALKCSRGKKVAERATQEFYASQEQQDQYENDDTPDGDSNDPAPGPNAADILSIMGLYVGGTYYVSRIVDSRRKRKYM